MDSRENDTLMSSNSRADSSERNEPPNKPKTVTISSKRFHLTIISLVVIIVALVGAVITLGFIIGTAGEKTRSTDVCTSWQCFGVVAELLIKLRTSSPH
ncbi:unnamed protein product [Caenorhabditis sp. 36 PRJEB53466]|nr:unnamed protein product [Caenorhabditis sp. 36 PRJEB53466]